jgi:hypothetical protein
MLAAPIIYGLVCAAFAQFLAFFMVGAGHGWIFPFWLSPALFLLYPAAFVRVVQKDSANLVPDLVLLLVAAGLDLLLYQNMTGAERGYIRGNAFEIAWLILWGLWQALLLWMLLRRLLRGRTPR